MTVKYRSIEGDMIDAVCAAHYGTEHGTTEAVLRHNPGLADYPSRLPDGVMITLPLLEKPAETVQTVNLWD